MALILLQISKPENVLETVSFDFLSDVLLFFSVLT